MRGKEQRNESAYSAYTSSWSPQPVG